MSESIQELKDKIAEYEKRMGIGSKPITKICKHCKLEKSTDDYQKAGGGKWLQPYCKPCDSERKKEYSRKNKEKVAAAKKRYYEENKDVLVVKTREYYEKNRESILSYTKEYNKINKESISQKGKEFRQQNIEMIKNRQRNYRLDNIDHWKEKEKKHRQRKTPEQKERDAILKKAWAERNKERLDQRAKDRIHIKREQRRIWCNKKSATDIGFKILKNLRSRTRFALKQGKIQKADTTEALLGCTIPFFKEYFCNLFTEGMTWEAFMRGEIHIDHIAPCNSFDLTKEDEQRKCFHHTNLQPLWQLDNLKKGSKILKAA